MKILDIYSFNNLVKIKEIAVTHLYSTDDLQSAHDLVGKEKVAEQHILTKYSKCNSFRVRSHLLKLAKCAITHAALGQSPKSINKFEEHKNPLGQVIYEKCVNVVALEKSV